MTDKIGTRYLSLRNIGNMVNRFHFLCQRIIMFSTYEISAEIVEITGQVFKCASQQK